MQYADVYDAQNQYEPPRSVKFTTQSAPAIRIHFSSRFIGIITCSAKKEMAVGSTVFVDLSGAEDSDTVQDLLAIGFAFPVYYGRNWDAFWDCITTLDPMPQKIRIKGLKDLAERLPRDAALLKKCLDDFRSDSDLASVDLQIE